MSKCLHKLAPKAMLIMMKQFCQGKQVKKFGKGKKIEILTNLKQINEF
jgi:hypothetical protein